MTNYNKILERAGLRPTDAREAVLETLYRIGRPASHGEVAEALRGELDRVTIYRNLYLLRKQELCTRSRASTASGGFAPMIPTSSVVRGTIPTFFV